MTVPTITLNDGTSIPQLGFGVFQVPPAETAETVTRRSRSATGTSTPRRCTERGGRRRGDRRLRHRPRRAVRDHQAQQRLPPARRRAPAFEESLEQARPGPRRPVPHPLAAADAVRRRLRVHVEDPGRARAGRPGHASIGVSNFQPAHLDRIIDETGVLPAVNQIEVHPFFGNEAARAAGAEHGIVTEAWSPIAQGKVIGDEVLAKIGAEHGKYRVAGRPPLAHPARRRRLPEVDARSSGCGRTSRSSTSRSRPSRSSRSAPSTRASPAGWARTRTSSTTSRTDCALSLLPDLLRFGPQPQQNWHFFCSL